MVGERNVIESSLAGTLFFDCIVLFDSHGNSVYSIVCYDA